MSVMKRVGGVLESVLAAPMLVKAGALSGVLSGLSLGLVVSAPVGIVLGLSLGATIGIVAGIVMDRDDQHSSHRTRQLDDIIGATVEPLPASPLRDAEEEGHAQELRSWVTEWMTPPPPHVS